jgi:tetratricopeptide (TPR) repeat protein
MHLKFIADSLYEKDNYLLAINYFDSLIQLDSTHGEYYFKRGSSYNLFYKQRAATPAISDFLTAIKLKYRESDAYFNLGISYASNNDSLAMLYFEKAVQLNPNDERAKDQISFCKIRIAEAKLLNH